MKPLDADQQRAVLDGAMQLFSQYNLEDISLDKLSKLTGVPAFNIVRHYHSSDNILKAVLERELELMAAAAQEPELRMPGETFGDELHVLAGVILDQYRKRVPFLTKILSEAMSDAKVGALFYSVFIVQGRLLFSEFLSIRKERNELRDEVDVEAAAAVFLASLTGMFMMYEIFGGKKVEKLDDDRVLGQMCDTFLRGGDQEMKVTVAGFEGPLALATRAELERRGHIVAPSGAECVIFFPGDLEALRRVALDPSVKRLVIRSHGYAYGSNPKNPGLMTEDRISLLPPDDEAQRWLKAEEVASAHPNSAAVRLASVTDAGEGDLLTTKLAARSATKVAGYNPNVQFISVPDAARALVAAAESNATGLFNAAGPGAIPLLNAFQAAGTKPKGRPAGPKVASLRYNWTLSNERAAQELGWVPQKSTVQALADFVAAKPGSHPELLKARYDDWGLDTDYIRAWGWWFAFLRNIYWRIDHEGMENVPETGRALYISNHRGFMPLDAVMHLSLLFTHRKRVPRFLIIHSLLRTPFMCDFLTKLGGVVASQENAAHLFAQEELVGLFPEGIRGTFTPYKRTHKLRDFSRSEFARLAVRNQAPVIPTAVVGHAEIFPIIGRIDSSWVVKELGWPYLPIAPMFPLAPIPLPSKWHVRVLKPIPLQGLRPEDADNDRLMKEFSRYVQDIVQRNVEDMAARRKSFIMGHFLDGTSPPVTPFRLARGIASA